MVYFILPVYNEGKGVLFQIKTIEDFIIKRKLDYKIIVVNDGSTDDTVHELAKIVNSSNVHLINHRLNQGPGMAFKSGFDYVRSRLDDEDIVITMDCDNTQHIRTIELMISKIEEGYEVVLGSIFIMGGMGIGIPFFRLLLSYSASMLYRIFFPIKGIKDYTAFYRAVKGSALKAAYERFGDNLIETAGFGCMTEMLIKFRQIPLFITEVPMIVRYDLKTSRSKLKIFKTIAEHLRIIHKNFFKRGLF